MSETYSLGPDEKSTQVMIGTADALIWGDLVTKEQVRMSTFLNTLADSFVPLFDAKLLFLSPEEQKAPIQRASMHIAQEEILLFFVMHDMEPPPEETETRRYITAQIIAGSYQMEGAILKPPLSSIQNLLLVSKATYLPVYRATVCHIAKPWLGSFTSNLIQVRSERMILTTK